uniref:Uncharacterized protein n=1 Tax=Rhipicephalus appendiculatus TaxID=34631 RepID=A0A131YFE4_RHIAP
MAVLTSQMVFWLVSCVCNYNLVTCVLKINMIPVFYIIVSCNSPNIFSLLCGPRRVGFMELCLKRLPTPALEVHSQHSHVKDLE